MLTPGSNILLTGATGLIGGELLRALLESDVGRIWALARPRGDVSAQQRVLDQLCRHGAERPHSAARLKTVAGDVRLSELGLGSEQARSIRQSVDLIIHSAADTSFIRADNCHETNVEGTRHIMEFAERCPRLRQFVFISTASNAGVMRHRCVTEEEGCNPDNRHYNAYTRSKALAEKMLQTSGLPVLIVRPSIVLSAGLQDPAYAKAILWFVPLLRAMNALPIDPAARLDIVPVSFVVQSILGLLDAPQRRHACYHLSAGPGSAVTCGEASRFIDRFYGRRAPLHLMHPTEWTPESRRRYVRTGRQRRIFHRIRYYLPFLNMDVVYDNARLREELGEQASAIGSLVSYLGELLTLMGPERNGVRLRPSLGAGDSHMAVPGI